MTNPKGMFLSFGWAVMLLFTVVPALGQEAFIERESTTNGIPNRIVGLWNVEVTVRNCSTGTPLANFQAMHKYELGGTGQVVPATNPATLSAHLAVWEHVYKDDFVMALKMFRFDAAGSYTGWTVIRSNINIENGLYSGSGVAKVYDAAGNQIGMSCPTFEGMRFQ